MVVPCSAPGMRRAIGCESNIHGIVSTDLCNMALQTRLGYRRDRAYVIQCGSIVIGDRRDDGKFTPGVCCQFSHRSIPTGRRTQATLTSAWTRRPLHPSNGKCRTCALEQIDDSRLRDYAWRALNALCV